ncbi:MAG: hypothetical protein OEL89_01415 [Candidatus Peregrinibacteria bacterium]|nr:hypothetical protein [Candidatus Peregrinibacteria bacterium]
MADENTAQSKDDKIPNPADARKMETFMKITGGKGDEATERALMGFFVIWSFEKNLADFNSPKIDLELVHKLHKKEITIEDFVKDSLKDEMTSKLFKNEADSFAKYYFNWKYISDTKALLGDKFESNWDNYAKVKVKIEERFSHWKKDPVVAQTEKLKEHQGEGARAGQLSIRKGHIFTIPAHPNTKFDEENFLILLEGSISLTMEEKQRVIDAIPRLKIEQINELIKIFTEERQKFAELENEFSDDVQKLKQEREKEILKTEDKKEEMGESEEAKKEAEELKKKLMG